MRRKIYRTRKHKRKVRHSRRLQKKLKGGGGNSFVPNLPSPEITQYIHKVVYYNLDSRTDRKEQVEKELSIFPPEKVERFPAIEDKEFPYYGMAQTVLSILKKARDHKWPNILMVEDDFQWVSTPEAVESFKKLVQNPYNVILFSGTGSKIKKNTNEVIHAQASAGYLISSSYYDTIISYIEDKIKNFLKSQPKDITLMALDFQFNKIENRNGWYMVYPFLAIQRPGISNASKNPTYTNYISQYTATFI